VRFEVSTAMVWKMLVLWDIIVSKGFMKTS